MINLHGSESSFALGWRSCHDQHLRFEVLAEIADLSGKTVLDAGCGYADLFAFLSNSYRLAHYYGIEQIPELLDQAEKHYGHLQNTTFISRNFLSGKLPKADFVLASGSLNYGSSDPGYIFKTISTLFENCTIGLGFNLLCSVPVNGLLVSYDPELILAHCRTLSDHVVLKTGYAAEDFTVFIFR
ncbi:MAG: methyltransferase domain-containing protein [Mucilaginibacter sp.]